MTYCVTEVRLCQEQSPRRGFCASDLLRICSQGNCQGRGGEDIKSGDPRQCPPKKVASTGPHRGAQSLSSAKTRELGFPVGYRLRAPQHGGGWLRALLTLLGGRAAPGPKGHVKKSHRCRC